MNNQNLALKRVHLASLYTFNKRGNSVRGNNMRIAEVACSIHQ